MEMDKLNIGNMKLEKVYFGIQRELGNAQEIECIDLQDLRGKIVATFKTAVWAEDAGRQFVVFPADWWQAVKERWFPAWALRRWPVKYQRWTLDVKVLYLDFKYALPDQPRNWKVVHQDVDFLTKRA